MEKNIIYEKPQVWNDKEQEQQIYSIVEKACKKAKTLYVNKKLSEKYYGNCLVCETGKYEWLGDVDVCNVCNHGVEVSIEECENR